MLQSYAMLIKIRLFIIILEIAINIVFEKKEIDIIVIKSLLSSFS